MAAPARRAGEDGAATGVAFAELDAEGVAPPRLSVVRIRSPMVGTGTDPETRLDLLWWFMVDDATGRTSTGSHSIAALPGRVAGPAPG